MHTRTPFQSLSIAAIFFSASFATVSIADELDAITVSADFRDSALQDVTTSISVIDSQDITDRGAQHIEDVFNLAPNVNMTSGASRARYFQIRGIGERSQFVTPINPSVGLTIDSMDFSRSGAAATLFDVKHVEVLRGPQGTKYGANGLAGVINITTTEPTAETAAHIETTLADYDTRAFGVAAGGSLNAGDTLLARGSVHTRRSDGTITNAHLNRDDTNGIDETTGRLHLKWLASEDMTIDAHYLFLDIDNGYDAFTLDNTRVTQSDQPGRDIQETHALSLQSQWQINSSVILESTLNHSDSDLEYSYDEDWSFVGQFDDALFPYSSFDQYLRNRKNTTLEYRLLSNEDGRIFNDRSDWVVGLYYADKSEDLTRNYTFLAEPFRSQYDTKNLALYSQLDTELNDRLILVTGLRVEQWDADYSDSDSITLATDELLYGGKIGLELELHDSHLSHISLSRGYKAGGVNADGTLPADNRNFSTEFLWSLEAGVNSAWFENNLTTRLVIFYAKRKDLQVNQSFVEIRDDNSTSFHDYLGNAGKGSNYGLEAELNWRINSQWQLQSSLGLLNATFDDYTDQPTLVGRDQAQSPSYQFSAGFDYDFAPGWSVGANIEGKDDYFLSDRHAAKSASYELFSANLSYRHNDWTAILWGKNLSDEEYAVRGFGSFGNNPGNGYAVEDYTQKGEPRMIGITLSYDY